MSETALASLFKAVTVQAKATGAPWGNRVFLDLAPLGTAMPYFVFQLQAGGEINSVRARDAEFVFVLKALDTSLPGALACAAEIESRFNDAGLYDRTLPLNAGTAWTVLTTTQERAIHLTELVDGRPIYHEGALFRVRMQAA